MTSGNSRAALAVTLTEQLRPSDHQVEPAACSHARDRHATEPHLSPSVTFLRRQLSTRRGTKPAEQTTDVARDCEEAVLAHDIHQPMDTPEPGGVWGDKREARRLDSRRWLALTVVL